MSLKKKHKPHPPVVEVIEVIEHEPGVERLLKEELVELRAIREELGPHTPTAVHFKENSMLDPVAGNTLVYTGTPTPVGSTFPTGTTFSVTSNYPNVTPSVDDTGLIITIPLGGDFVDDPNNPLSIHYETSTFTPQPAGSATSVSADITPTIPLPPPPPPPATPTGISFVQTT